MDQLPQELLEMVFAHLSLPELCKSHVFVSKQWRDVIMREKFMKWQKVYYKYRSGDAAASIFLRNISQEVGMASVRACLKNLVTYVYSLFDKDQSGCASNALRSLQSHRHYDLAMQVLNENYGLLMDQNHQLVWSIAAVTCLLSSDAWGCYDLLKILTLPDSEYTSLDVRDKLYCILSFFLYFANEFRVSTRWHYNLFQALHWFENSFEEAPIIQGASRLTHEQLRIINHDLKPSHVIKVVAFAGTGKTSTMIHFTRRNPGTRFLLVMFNKAAIEDAKAKFPENVQCCTIHSLAHREVVRERYKGRYRKELGNINVFDLESSEILHDRTGFKRYQHRAMVLETLNRYMASADRDIAMYHAPTSLEKVDTNTAAVIEVPLTENQRKTLVADARTVWDVIRDPKRASETKLRLPHDAYLKIWQLEKPDLRELIGVDCIIVDEAQDMTAAMLDIVLGHSGSRIIVGDPHQQVYQWRYAINALDRVNPTHTYYLTQSFRFGSEVGYLASSCLSVLKGVSKKSLVGSEIRDSLSGEVTDLSHRNGQICYIARTNLELFKKVIEVITPYIASTTSTSGKPPIKIAFAGGVTNMGFNTIKCLYYLWRGDVSRSKKGLPSAFDTFNKFENFVRDTGDKEWAAKLAIVQFAGDRIEEYVQTIDKLTVKSMADADVVFATAHKSKGLEWDTVVLLDDFVPRLTSYRDKADDQQEPNLLYVAVTRARRHLVINSACYYVLLLAGHRQEEIVSTEEQYLTHMACSSCHQELPGHFGRRSVSLATLPLQVMTKTGTTMALHSGLLCSGCACRSPCNLRSFEAYPGMLQTTVINDNANHMALEFLVGPKEEGKESDHKANDALPVGAADLQGVAQIYPSVQHLENEEINPNEVFQSAAAQRND